MRTLKTTVFLLIVALCCPAFAQWDEDGNLIGEQPPPAQETYYETDAEDYSGGGGVVMEEEPPQTEPPEGEVDMNYFYEALSPYGDWIWTAEYGWVWKPREVPANWRPYTYGRWVYTEYGWTWVSYFEWGWAPFHYGQWAWLAPFGWVWVPGTVWAPAWVVWRYSDAYIGWAPLLAGYDFWFGWAYYPIIYEHWTFVDWGHFCDHHPHHHYLPRQQVAQVFKRTFYPKGCRNSAGPGCLHGPVTKLVEKRLGAPVTIHRAENLADKLRPGERFPTGQLKVSDDRVEIFRPRAIENLQTAPGRKFYPGTKSIDFGPAGPGKKFVPPQVQREHKEQFAPPATRSPRPEPGKSIFTPRPKANVPYIPAPKAWKPNFGTNHNAPSPSFSPPAASSPGMKYSPAPGGHTPPAMQKHAPPAFQKSTPQLPSTTHTPVFKAPSSSGAKSSPSTNAKKR